MSHNGANIYSNKGTGKILTELKNRGFTLDTLGTSLGQSSGSKLLSEVLRTAGAAAHNGITKVFGGKQLNQDDIFAAEDARDIASGLLNASGERGDD